jgi:hypothetical protein
VSSFGRLCRELAAVRARAKPVMTDAYVAQNKARMQSSDPYFTGAVVPGPRDVEQWVLAIVRRVASDNNDKAFRVDPDLIGTTCLRDGLKAAGYAVTKEALAVLRSAFRIRAEFLEGLPFSVSNGFDVSRALVAFNSTAPAPARGPAASTARTADGSDTHAAILVNPLCMFLVCDDATAFAMLQGIDDFAQKRSGKARPVQPPVLPGMGMSTSLPAAIPAPMAVPFFSPPVPGAYVPAGMMPMPSTPMGGTMQGFASRGGHTASAGVPAAFGATAPAAAAPIPASVGEYLRTFASFNEKENLMSFLGLVSEYEQRLGLPQTHTAVSVSEGGESLVINLGPHLKAGIRFFV